MLDSLDVELLVFFPLSRFPFVYFVLLSESIYRLRMTALLLDVLFL